MPSAARNLLVMLAALFLSAGHVACACASAAAPLSPFAALEGVEANSGDSHAHHHGRIDDRDEQAPAPVHSDCSHCTSAMLAADGIAKVATTPSLQKNVGFVASAGPEFSRDVRVGIRDQRLRWAAPPRRTPVSLKIRLRN